MPVKKIKMRLQRNQHVEHVACKGIGPNCDYEPPPKQKELVPINHLPLKKDETIEELCWFK
jgi:hypothetical protein